MCILRMKTGLFIVFVCASLVTLAENNTTDAVKNNQHTMNRHTFLNYTPSGKNGEERVPESGPTLNETSPYFGQPGNRSDHEQMTNHTFLNKTQGDFWERINGKNHAEH